jgi:hypothetical protein
MADPSFGGALHGAQHPDMTAAAAEISRKRRSHLFFCRFGSFRQQRDRAHDHSICAVAALGGLFGNECRLNRMQVFRRAETFQCRDVSIADGRHGNLARANGLAIENNRAGAALSETAAKFWAVEAETIAQGIQQRHIGIISVDIMRSPIDAQVHGCHRRLHDLCKFYSSATQGCNRRLTGGAGYAMLVAALRFGRIG